MRKASAHATVLRVVEEARDEIIDFTRQLIRIPTVNPPGDCYEPCARLLGDALRADGFAVDYFIASARPEHTAARPRVNVVGRRAGPQDRPAMHLNGHIDVVPVGHGWTLDPFGAVVRNGRIYGRGAADMKSGIAAARFAAEAIRRAGIELTGTLEISGTVDEESGGWAGAAHLAEVGRLTNATIDFVIIPEPLNVDRVCVGHRGVCWFELTTRGRIAHGSMPFLGISAIDHMGEVLHRLRTVLQPELARRLTGMPVVPDDARRATININSIVGGQAGHLTQSPCVADRCTATLDRRFLPEESASGVRDELIALLDGVRRDIPDFDYELRDTMLVHPVRTPEASPLIASVAQSIEEVIGRRAAIVASPGTYDHKHVTGIGGIADCIAYGPGRLEVSHLPDEWCDIDDLVRATQVIALSILDLIGPAGLRSPGGITA